VFTRIAHDQRKRQGAGDLFAEQIIIEADGTYPVSSLNKTLHIESSSHYPDDSVQHDLVLTADHISYPLLLRAHQPGEKMRPAGAPGRKKVSRILSSRKIPKYLRHCFPVLVFQEQIIAIPGLSVSEEFKPRKEASRYLIIGWKEFKKE
jgi:tRNA(Ile)-lysidine synthase